MTTNRFDNSGLGIMYSLILSKSSLDPDVPLLASTPLTGLRGLALLGVDCIFDEGGIDDDTVAFVCEEEEEEDDVMNPSGTSNVTLGP